MPPGLISALKIVPFRDLIYECLLSKEEMKTKETKTNTTDRKMATQGQPSSSSSSGAVMSGTIPVVNTNTKSYWRQSLKKIYRNN